MCCSASAETGPSSTRPGTPTLHDVPILGVNMGSVGFMAELERGELSLLTLLAAGEYRTEERMMLSVRVLRGEKVLSEDLALNDAVSPRAPWPGWPRWRSGRTGCWSPT